MSSNLRFSSKEQLELFTDLGTMLTAGIPILEAVDLLLPDTKADLRKILVALRAELLNGHTLSSAMAQFPKAFEPVVINLIRAAEAGGTLEETLQDIVRTLKKQVAFGNNLRTAMIYPAFVMVLFSGIVIMLLTFVIPRISKVFLAQHVKIPWATRHLMLASTYFLAHWPIVIAGIIALVALLGVIVHFNKRAIAHAILSLPGLRRLGITIDLAQLTRSMTLLLKAGVPIDEALALTKKTVQKKQIIAVISRMQQNVAAGKPLATGLRGNKGVVPPLMVRSLETAETSGTLEHTLQSLAEHFDEKASEALRAITSLIEPLMIVGVGVLVGGLMITVIAPVYSMMSQIRPSGG